MRKGGGKGKGAAFEREVCKALSLWFSDGRRQDLFWRSAMSGGRATLGSRRGEDLSHQAGDICAVHPEGHRLTNSYYVECKFYRSLDLGGFLFGKGRLARFWATTCTEAVRYNRFPLLIARENRGETLMIFVGARTNRRFKGTEVTFIKRDLRSCVFLFLKDALKASPDEVLFG